MAELTVQVARDAFLRFKVDLSDISTNIFAEWCDFINRFIYKEASGIDPERFISTSSFTVTTIPSTQTLPSDFRDIQKTGCGFFFVDADGKDTDRALTQTGFGRRDRGYYIQGTNVVFTGIENNEVFTLRYIPTTTKLTALADFFTQNKLTGGKIIIDDEYLEYVVKALDVLYDQRDEEPGAESIADARFVRALNNLLDNLKKEPGAYQLDDFTLPY